MFGKLYLRGGNSSPLQSNTPSFKNGLPDDQEYFPLHRCSHLQAY